MCRLRFDKALEGQLFAACTLASLFGMATAGIFYEGVMTAGYASGETDAEPSIATEDAP